MLPVGTLWLEDLHLTGGSVKAAVYLSGLFAVRLNDNAKRNSFFAAVLLRSELSADAVDLQNKELVEMAKKNNQSMLTLMKTPVSLVGSQKNSDLLICLGSLRTS